MHAQRPCPVCGSESSLILHRHEHILFDGHPLAGICSTAVCEGCGMGFNCTTAPVAAYAQHYGGLSKYATSFSPLAGAARFSGIVDIIERLNPNRDAAILDAGFGGGGLLAALHARGYRRLSGLDASPACVDAVRKELGVDARIGFLANPPFPIQCFDLILSTGVLEHLLNPGMDIEAMCRLLRPDGKVFVVVPDADRYVDFLEAPFQEFNIEHINHFSGAALSTLFTLRGWTEHASGACVLDVTPNWREAVLFGLYSFSGEDRHESPSCSGAGERLAAYVAGSAALLECIDLRLRNQLVAGEPIALWGTGQTASILLGQTALRDVVPHIVIDGNPAYWGRTYCGTSIGKPDDAGDFSGPIVIASIREQSAITEKIRKQLKWDNRIITLLDSGGVSA